MTKSLPFALATLLLAGCMAGRKPANPDFKVRKESRPLACPPASWKQGDLKFELSKLEMVRDYTFLRAKHWKLYFHVRVKNTGKRKLDVFDRMPNASLILQDGTFVEGLVWNADSVKLGPGKETKAVYFSDQDLGEDPRPKKLAIDGLTVASW